MNSVTTKRAFAHCGRAARFDLATRLLRFGYIPELFPTEVRLRGTGVAGTVGRASSIITPWLALLLYERFGVSGVIAM